MKNLHEVELQKINRITEMLNSSDISMRELGMILGSEYIAIYYNSDEFNRLSSISTIRHFLLVIAYKLGYALGKSGNYERLQIDRDDEK